MAWKHFAQLPVEAIMDDRIRGNKLLVLSTILSFADKHGFAKGWTREQMAERCKLPVTRFSSITSELESIGWLKKVGLGGRSLPCEYQVTIPKTVTDSVTVLDVETVTESVTVTELVTVTENVTDIDEKRLQILNETVTESVTKTVTDSVTRPIDAYQPHKLHITPTVPIDDSVVFFDEFWSAYPKKVAKRDAERAWKKIKPNIYQTIILDVRARAETDGWKKNKGQFVPNPATYLNGARWEDQMPKSNKQEMLDWINGIDDEKNGVVINGEYSHEPF